MGHPVPSLPARDAEASSARHASARLMRLISPLISSVAGVQPGSQAAESVPVPAGTWGCSLPSLGVRGDGSCPPIPLLSGSRRERMQRVRAACTLPAAGIHPWERELGGGGMCRQRLPRPQGTGSLPAPGHPEMLTAGGTPPSHLCPPSSLRDSPRMLVTSPANAGTRHVTASRWRKDPLPHPEEELGGGISGNLHPPCPVPGVAPSSPGALGARRDSLLQLPSGIIN